MDFTKVVRKRRSTRRFTTQPVRKSDILKIVEDATYAPTPCNQQLWKFIAITDDHLKNKLVKEAKSSTIIRRAPVVMVVCYDTWSTKEAIQSASLATQNILLSATNRGIGVLAMNSFGNEKKLKKILGIPQNYLINCFICFGYATEVYNSTPPVPRKSVEEVLCFNSFHDKYNSHRSYRRNKWTKDMLIEYQKHYCRKTFLGKEMDIMDEIERKIVRRALHKSRNIIDYFSYDGGMLQLFPDTSITSVNLDNETTAYTKAALNTYCKEKNVNFSLYGDTLSSTYDYASLIFKVERLPDKLRYDVINKMYNALSGKGEIIIVSRLPTFLFSCFYHLIRTMFGDDIRRTGIYAFFGPYQPVPLRVLKKDLTKRGFSISSVKKYSIIPPFFNQALQMLFQFIKSGGTTYLHREKHINILLRVVERLIRVTSRRPSLFGSVVVLKAKKKYRK